MNTDWITCPDCTEIDGDIAPCPTHKVTAADQRLDELADKYGLNAADVKAYTRKVIDRRQAAWQRVQQHEEQS